MSSCGLYAADRISSTAIVLNSTKRKQVSSKNLKHPFYNNNNIKKFLDLLGTPNWCFPKTDKSNFTKAGPSKLRSVHQLAVCLFYVFLCLVESLNRVPGTEYSKAGTSPQSPGRKNKGQFEITWCKVLLACGRFVKSENNVRRISSILFVLQRLAT